MPIVLVRYWKPPLQLELAPHGPRNGFLESAWGDLAEPRAATGGVFCSAVPYICSARYHTLRLMQHFVFNFMLILINFQRVRSHQQLKMNFD